MNIKSLLAQNLRAMMDRAGMVTYADLASAAGLSRTQVGNILRSERGASVDSLQSLADGLGCEPWQLLAPVSLASQRDDIDVQNLVQCILELHSEDREAIWRLIYRLHVATRNSELF